jgi:hypothetical protein
MIKYLLLTILAVASCTTQCMEKTSSTTLSLEQLKIARYELSRNITRNTPSLPDWLHLAMAQYPRGNYICNNTIIIPSKCSVDDLQSMTYFKNTQVNGYTVLGAATLDAPDKKYWQTKEFITNLLAAGYQPTDKDKKLAIILATLNDDKPLF